MAEFDWYAQWQHMFGERDGRLRVKRGEVFGKAGPLDSQLWEPAFCYCGTPCGYITKGTPVLVICDQCTATYGKLPLPELTPIEEG